MEAFAASQGAADPLLATKLYIPPPRARLVARPDLLARLDAGLAGPLTLIAAPAGAGKTTLLGAWHAAHPDRPLAWVALDAGDNDPVRFWRYVLAALQGRQPGLGAYTQTLLELPRPPAPETLLAGLINELAALDHPLILVLDDYHVITAPVIEQSLAYLLDHLPPTLRLVLATRTDPDLPLARLRARGQVVELHLADLRFSADEAGRFLNDVLGLGLPPGAVATLAERTEGWPAGLQLAGLSLQGRADSASFIGALGGQDRFIADYLVEEVLARLPEADRAFLLATSVLDRLSGPLSDALTGGDDGQATLERLERANLFLIPLDNDRRWYRYHHLFADLLRHQLARTRPALVPVLHRRASAWYDEQGLLREAVPHALAAADIEHAADLIERQAQALLMRSELVTLRGWLDALPPPVLAARPRLLVAHTWPLICLANWRSSISTCGRSTAWARRLIPPCGARLRRCVRSITCCKGIIWRPARWPSRRSPCCPTIAFCAAW